MRRDLLLITLCALGLALAACKTNEADPGATPAAAEPTKAEPTKAEPTKAEPTKAEPAAKEEAKAEPAAKEEAKAEPAGEGSAAEHCGAAYDFVKQMMEAFAKKAGTKAKKELPPRDKYIAACKELPLEVTRCMNPKIAMTEAEKCREAMTKVNKEKLAKLRSMMK